LSKLPALTVRFVVKAASFDRSTVDFDEGDGEYQRCWKMQDEFDGFAIGIDLKVKHEKRE
jgi:hypothetical protein